MKITAEVVTPWIGDGLTKQTAFRPKLTDFYNAKMSDTTSQPNGELPPKPNIYVIWIEAEDTIVDAIETDSDYYILYRGDESEGIPSASEFGQLRSYLATAGADQEQINTAIGGSVAGRSRTEIVESMKEWMRTLHK